MKTIVISYLLATLLNVAFVHAQNVMAPKSSAESYRFLLPGLERHLDKVAMDALHQKFFRSPEDSLYWVNPAPPINKWGKRWETPRSEQGSRDRGASLDSELSLPSRQAQNGSGTKALTGNVQDVWRRHYAAGFVPAYDIATAMASDTPGNVYVTGYSTNRFGFDYFTAKYNAAGVQLWSARYNGVENGDDRALAIAVDVSGNVYVTGESYGTGASYDYATIKYNSDGALQWVARYNGPGNFDDYAITLAVDAAGNVCVTGYSIGIGTSYDYATIKYNSAGVEQWIAYYNGPGNSYDKVTALAVDLAGNIYVAGYSCGSGTSSDYATIKYNSAGVEQWVARYDGSGNPDFGDVAYGLAVDNSGNVYVTGCVYGSLTSYDYATVKYNGAGAPQWVARYNGPGNPNDYAKALAVDAAGNVYVMGVSYGSGTFVDYVTVKYDSTGFPKWVARYNGPGNSNDIATAIALDLTGNVYVTGYSGTYPNYDYATVKYNGAGVTQWVANYNRRPENSDDNATALAVDPAGNVYVTGCSYNSDTNYDYATVKYNAAGTEQWVAHYNGPGNSDDAAYALGVDDAGNVYITGRSYGASTGYDYATIKYNRAGIEQWVARHNGPGNSDDYATAIAVDPSGNVYVMGCSYGSGTAYDYATIKYNAAGTEQWVARYNGPGNSEDHATAIAVDPAGNIYVTGYSRGTGTNNDYATVKYNAAGVEQWVARYNNGSGPGSPSDNATALAVDPAGNVYVTGYSVGSGTSDDYVTIKYNSAGAPQWVTRYNGPGNFNDYATALTLDPAGNVYVSGYSYGSGTAYDYATIKYNSAGAPQWVARYNGPGNSDDQATSLAVDPAGNTYVTGWSADLGFDYATVKYNGAGALQWVARYDGQVNGFNYATALTLDPAGNVYVTGYSMGSGTGYDYATIKYNGAGAPQWVARSDGPGHPYDYAQDLAIDNLGNIYVTGKSYDANNSRAIYTTIKYIQGSVLTSTKMISDEMPAAFELGANYPNPFSPLGGGAYSNPETTIEYAVPAQNAGIDVYVTLHIYNLQGQLVRTLVEAQQSPGRYRVVWDGKNDTSARVASGVYLYVLTSGHFKVARRMAILK